MGSLNFNIDDDIYIFLSLMPTILRLIRFPQVLFTVYFSYENLMFKKRLNY